MRVSLLFHILNKGSVSGTHCLCAASEVSFLYVCPIHLLRIVLYKTIVRKEERKEKKTQVLSHFNNNLVIIRKMTPNFFLAPHTQLIPVKKNLFHVSSLV